MANKQNTFFQNINKKKEERNQYGNKRILQHTRKLQKISLYRIQKHIKKPPRIPTQKVVKRYVKKRTNTRGM
jgi:hypothetical protein